MILGAERARLTHDAPATIDRRSALIGGAVGAWALTWPSVATSAPADDVVVTTTLGRNHLPSVAAAIDAARAARRPFRIRVLPGVWQEKLTIDVPDLTIVGDGPASIISFGAAAGHRRADGERWGTGGSATVTVTAPGVNFERLTIRNSFDYLADQRTQASGGAQAVALSLAVGADRTIVRDCGFEGYQDTLYVREGRAWFERCRIAGGTDFIFGGAAARFHACEIVSRNVAGDIAGFVAAPSTPAVQPVGLVFTNCRLTREPGLRDASVYLGRPWRAGGNMALTGSAAFIGCWMDAHIRRDGWTSMGFTAPDGTRRQLTPREARLTEFNSRGPGAGAASDTRRMIDAANAAELVRATDYTAWRPRG